MKLLFGHYPYILYQRTAYMRPSHMPRVRKRFYKFFVNAEALLNRNSISEKYQKDIESDVNEILPFVPENVTSVLDIGAGMGGHDVLLYHRLKPKELWLLDKTAIEKKIWYKFNKKGAAYNSVPRARELLVLNGVPPDVIHTVDMIHENFPVATFDLITSFISWGFHYPISTYLDDVLKTLSPNGTLILDVRKGTTGVQELAKHFEVKIISETPKCLRLVCNYTV